MRSRHTERVGTDEHAVLGCVVDKRVRAREAELVAVGCTKATQCHGNGAYWDHAAYAQSIQHKTCQPPVHLNPHT